MREMLGSGWTPDVYPSFGAMMTHERTSMVRSLSEGAGGSVAVGLTPWSEQAG